MSLALSRRAKRGEVLPYAGYGVEPSFGKAPDFIEPFRAYRAWNWTAEGVTSLNGALWTPKVAFEATCPHDHDLRSMQATCSSEAASKFWSKHTHYVPDPTCTCACTRESTCST